MFKVKHIIFRRIGSAFLTALLLSVYTIQVLHAHPPADSRVRSDNTTDTAYLLKEEPGSCLVCQFEFTREALLPELDTGIRPLAVFSILHDRLGAFFYSVPSSFFHLRGPPSA